MKRRSAARKTKKLLLHELRLSNFGYKSIAGVDEAGRGPLAGPVVAGAVILKSYKFLADIDDSKKLSDKKRRVAYKEILKKAFVGVGIVDEKVIDEVNIYQATIRAMQAAIQNLEVPPDYIIVDGRVKLATNPPMKCIVRGDTLSLSIAAASIIAKVTRDNIMQSYHEQYPQYGFSRHKGYPTKAHKKALRIHGPSPIHRFSFRPVKELV